MSDHVSENTDAQSNHEQKLETSKHANEIAKRDGKAAELSMNFARNREYLQKKIMKLESKIETQSMKSSVAAPPDVQDHRYSIAGSEFSDGSQAFDRSSQVG